MTLVTEEQIDQLVNDLNQIANPTNPPSHNQLRSIAWVIISKGLDSDVIKSKYDTITSNEVWHLGYLFFQPLLKLISDYKLKNQPPIKTTKSELLEKINLLENSVSELKKIAELIED